MVISVSASLSLSLSLHLCLSVLVSVSVSLSVCLSVSVCPSLSLSVQLSLSLRAFGKGLQRIEIKGEDNQKQLWLQPIRRPKCKSRTSPVCVCRAHAHVASLEPHAGVTDRVVCAITAVEPTTSPHIAALVGMPTRASSKKSGVG